MADINGGGLHFTSGFDNDAINKALEQTIDRIQGFSGEFVKSGDEIDQRVVDLVNSFELQKKTIKELEDEYKNLRKEQSNFDLGSDEHERLGQNIESVRVELVEEIQALDSLKSELKDVAIESVNTAEALGRIGEATSAVEQVKRASESASVSVSLFKDNTVKGSGQIDEAFQSVSKNIDKAFSMLDNASNDNITELRKLQEEYRRLGDEAGRAFQKGKDDDYRAIESRRRAIASEITTRQSLLKEISNEANELEKVSKKFDSMKDKAQKSADAQVLLRTELNNVKNQMAQLARAGQTGSAQYAELTAKAESLTRAVYASNQQIKILTSVKGASLQGLVSGLSGLAGGFSAVTGAVSLFSTENENLQKIMVKVQSLMAITIGLQQVQTTLNKDSAFQLTVLSRARQAYANSMAVSNRAMQMGITTNLGLSASFRAIGASIKSIPVFGWIATGITALSIAYSKLSSSARKAKKEQEEYYKAIADNVHKPVASLKALEAQFNALDNSMQSKERFINDNKRAFESLGIVINSVADAERILTNPENVQKFVQAQIQKAKATAQLQEIMERENELMVKRQEYSSMADTMNQLVQTSSMGGGYYQEVENIDKINLKNEIDRLNADLQFKYKFLAQTENDGNKKLDEINQEALKNIEGSIVHYRKLIKEKTDAMEVMNDPEQIKLAQKEIAKLQDTLNSLQDNKKAGKAEKDTFTESLNFAKEEYKKYFEFTTSTDESIRNSADETFKNQLEQGATYLEFLRRKKDELLKGDQSAETIRRIKVVNEKIASETQHALDAETKLYNDNLERIVNDYYNYYDIRKKIQEDFDNDMAILNEQSQKAESDSQKKFIQTMIENRKREYDKSMRDAGSGDAEYDAMVRQFEDFEQQRLRIAEEYAQRRALALSKGDSGMIEQLNKAEQKELQSISFDQLLDSETYNQLFSNLDRLTVEKMIQLRNKLESEWSNLNLSPEQWEALRNRIDKVTDEIEKRNPFLALLDSIKRYKNGEKGIDFKDIAKSASASIDITKGAFDAVLGGFNELGIAGDEVTQQLMSDISDMIGSAGDLAMGIASGNPLQIIQGAVGLLTSAFKVFNVQDRKADRQIAKHAENLKTLEQSYKELEKAIDKALGSNRYTTTQNAIRNLEKQQKEIAKQAELERGKKKSDKGKVKEYEDALKSAKEQQADLIEQLRADILGIDAKSAAEQLGQAFVDAFKMGGDAVEAFGKKADDVVANIMQRMLVQKLLEEPIGQIFDRYSKRWYSDNGDFLGFDSVISDANSLGSEMKGLGEGFAKAMESLPEEIKKYFVGGDGEDVNSLSGAIKGITEETASILSGQVNAMRITQAEASELLRSQLMQLSQIAQNTSYNRYIKSIDDRMARMESGNTSLRSQGLI